GAHRQGALSRRQHALQRRAGRRRRTHRDRAEPRGDRLQRLGPPGPEGAPDLAARPYAGDAGMTAATGIAGSAGRWRLSTFLYLRPKLALLLLLLPPVLWLGIVYLGSLFALLAQSFFSIDDFSGLTIYQPTLSTYAELFTPTNLQIILRTVVMAAVVTLACAAIGF